MMHVHRLQELSGEHDPRVQAPVTAAPVIEHNLAQSPPPVSGIQLTILIIHQHHYSNV